MMKIKKLLLSIFLCVFASYACVCMADSDEVRHPYMLGGVWLGDIVEEVHVGARMGSYKPDLRELDDLLALFGTEPSGASTMYNVFARFEGSPQLSYLVEIGHWGNEISVESMDVDMEATLTHLSLGLLYYPELIQKYAPLYLGIGCGIAHIELNGSALTLLSDVVKDSEETGVCGNIVVGLEYPIMERLMVNIQANHIFKSLTVDEEEEREFSFDGTAVSIGISGRL